MSLTVALLAILFDFERTFLSGFSRTTRSFGTNRHDKMTVADKLKHIAIVVS
jgi:hypothetical protein